MLKKVFCVGVLLSFIIVLSVTAGPFGLEMGMSLEKFDESLEKLGPGIYKVVDVPNPHSAFDFYVIRVAPKNGLYFIKAIGKAISTNTYGTQLEGEFHSMEEKLTDIYGDPDKMDFLYADSIWDEPEDWMMGLIKKERVLLSVWEEKEEQSLPKNLKMVILAANPVSQNEGFLSIEYYFDNFDAGEEEISSKEDDAL